MTVYVGNNLAAFDEGVRENADAVVKPAGEFWVTYAGTLGASYDLSTLVQAAKLAEPQVSGLRVKILGDGPTAISSPSSRARLARPSISLVTPPTIAWRLARRV